MTDLRFGVFMGLVAGSLIGFAFGIEWGVNRMEYRAIIRGYAQYCPTDGAFAWNGGCRK